MKYEDFISKFPKVTKTIKGVSVKCPAHDGKGVNSLSIGRADDGGVILYCFAGCTTESVVTSLGLKMRDLFGTEKAVAFTPPAYVPPKNDEPDVLPVIDKIYSYQNELGKEVFQALRMKPKSFRQRHMEDGKWKWTMDGVTRVLFRLPEILKSQQVWIVEGEKDALNLVAVGFQATCNVGGAGKWLDGYTESLSGKDVVICGDNDEAGAKHVELVFNSIAGAVKTVKIVKLPASIKDASDFIAGFKDISEAKAALHDLESSAHPHIKGIGLPIYTISELEAEYKRFVGAMSKNSFWLGSWLPSLGRVRPLVPGELVFIIGDTGTGKTGILQNIARVALPLPTLMFELELPREMMFERFTAQITGLTCENVESNYRAASGAENTMADIHDERLKNLFICTESRLSVEKIEQLILRSELKIGERPRVVLVDYIQLIAGESSSRRERISDIAEALKVLAKSTRTIIIVTSQVSRPPKSDEDYEPTLHSAKESGSIESSCGVLIGAWRDSKDGGLMHVKVLKSTKGGTGAYAACNFDGQRMIIKERSKISNDDIP
jgi:5S rRNA maturation endonuclease (ribonuclease M5)